MEPHLSGTVLILGTGAVLMLVGGINLGWVIAAVGGAAGVAALMFSGIITYGQSRIAMWHNPWLDAQGDGYQLVQSLISIGSGGLLGVGLGKSRQKYLYLPEEHNDYIHAECSGCGFQVESYDAVETGRSSTEYIKAKWKFCPKCGAKMKV